MQQKSKSRRIVVIDAGAAGLMAGAAAASQGARVTILEKNEKAGKKIYITGKGRCNLTNTCDTADYFDHVVRNPKFLYSAIYGFDSSAVMSFMEENGCRVKTERGGRVFPVSDHASDVTRALLQCLGRHGAEIRYNTAVRDILVKKKESEGERPAGRKVLGVRLANGQTVHADAVILCTGGRSYPSTGSTGDGYKMAERLGIRVQKPAPSLVPLCVTQAWCRQLQGLSLKNVQLTLRRPQQDGQEKGAAYRSSGRKKEILYTGFGEMLFTHFGISGPLVLTASCYADFDACSEFMLLLDLKPYMTQEELEARIRREFADAKGKHLANVLRALFPASLAKVMAQISGLGEDRAVVSVSDKEIAALASLIKAVPMRTTGTRGFNEAIVTKGGLDVRSFDPSTMECRQIEGLYCAGEVLDVDAHTGGYNLQIAWSTGHLAGESAAAAGS